MRHRPISYALALVLLPIACDGGTNDGVLAEDRKPLGKADASGSCFDPVSEADFCGSKSAGSCWCDEQCEFYGDCCGDVALACGTIEDTGDTGNTGEAEDPFAALGFVEDETYWVSFEVGDASFSSACSGSGSGNWFPETGWLAFRLDANETGGYWLEIDEFQPRHATGYPCSLGAAKRLSQQLARNVLLVPDDAGVLSGKSQWKGPGAHTLEHAVVTARIQDDGLHIDFDGSAYWSDYGGGSRYKLKAKFVLTSDDVTLPDA